MINISFKTCCQNCNEIDVYNLEAKYDSGETRVSVGCEHEGLCKEFNKPIEIEINQEEGTRSYSMSGSVVAEITDDVIKYKEAMAGIAISQWGFCKDDVIKKLALLNEYEMTGLSPIQCKFWGGSASNLIETAESIQDKSRHLPRYQEKVK